MLSRWRKEYFEGQLVADERKVKSTPSDVHSEQGQLRQLKERIAELELENDLLKKWQRFLAEQRRKNSRS